MERTDGEILEAILGLIGKDDDLLGAFAAAIEEPRENLEQFIDFVEIPELTRKTPQDLKK